MTFLAHPGVPPDQGGASPADELGMGVHGGTDETSLMLHLAPELVDMTAADAPRARAPGRQPLRALRRAGVVRLAVRRLRRRRRTSATRPPATAERGAALFDGAVDAFCGALGEIAAVRAIGRLSRDRATRRSTCASTATGCGRGIVELGEIGAIKGPDGERGLRPPGPDRRRPRRAATSSSAGCATSASTCRSTPSATSSPPGRAPTRRRRR